MPDGNKVIKDRTLTIKNYYRIEGPDAWTHDKAYSHSIEEIRKDANELIKSWKKEKCPHGCGEKINEKYCISRIEDIKVKQYMHGSDQICFEVSIRVWGEYTCPQKSEPEQPEEKPDDMPTDDDEEVITEEEECCPGKLWVCYGGYTGGQVVMGLQSGWVRFFCIDNIDHNITMTFDCARFGFALGGEGSGILGIAWEVEHAEQLVKLWNNSFNWGPDFDLSVGLPIVKILKILAKGKKAGKLRRVLQDKIMGKEHPINLDREQLKDIKRHAEAFIKDSARGVPSAKFGNLYVFPFGPGVQAGIWWDFLGGTKPIEFNCCDCNFPKQEGKGPVERVWEGLDYTRKKIKEYWPF